jgi:hypothetical protein
VYARVITVQVRPDKFVDAHRLLTEHALPFAERQSGYKGYLVLHDPASGKALQITLWESEAANILAASREEVQGINAQFYPLLVPGQGGAEGFDVVVDTLAKPSRKVYCLDNA